MGAVERFSATLTPGAQGASAILAALSAAERFARAAPLTAAGAARLAVIIEELVSNVLRHGAAGHKVTMELTLRAQERDVVLVLVDDGAPFDPTATRGFAGPDPQSGGGVGLELVKAWSRDLTYLREEGRNRLALTLPDAGGAIA